MLEGMALAALVVWLFLRDWRATAVTAVAMPVSLIPTFAFMSLVGFSLNIVTLLGLTLVIGILVDDAIVEIENIEKRVLSSACGPSRRPWRGPTRSAWRWSPPPSPSWWCSCRCRSCPAFPGQFFREFGLTVSVAVLFSLVVARLLTPLLAAYFLKPKPAREPRAAAAGSTPAPLNWALDHRWLSVAHWRL